MKKLITFFSICTTVAILALPAAARTSIAQPDIATQECTPEAKDALYASFLKNRQNEQAKAYEDAKKYLACPAGEVTEAQQKIIDYLKKWVTAYEKGMRKIRLTQLLYTDMKYPEAYALGKEILAEEPDNLKILVDLGANGYLVAPLNNAALTADSLGYAKRALEMLEGGKTVEDWAPLANRDVAVAYLNYTIGTHTLQNDPSTALKHLLKAAQFETPLKKSPYTFAYIAGAYETGPYAKQSQQYKEMYSGKDETPESKLALANINQLVDRMIDGYARAVALAGSDAKFASQKPVWTESLMQWYKFRNNNTDAGMNELVAGILAKPLPPEPTPLTSLPAAPAATPVGNTGAPQTNGATNAPATTPATTTPATGTKPATTPATTTPATGTKPAPKPDRPRQ
jgi:tetratricopeptide (TPR) repeat protein